MLRKPGDLAYSRGWRGAWGDAAPDRDVGAAMRLLGEDLIGARLDSLIVINGWRTLSPHTRRCFETRLALLRHAGVEAFLRAQPLFLFPPDWIAAHDDALKAELAKALAKCSRVS